jgi:H+/Cl- antiporter ClcA
MPWFLSAGIFGLVLGGLYLAGGQPVQFSGSEGIKLLLANQVQYGAWAFLGLAVVKLLGTAWSKTTGYRGGMFFPSIFVGVALSMFVGSLFNALGGTGTMIGAIAAIFMVLSIKDEPDITHKDYFLAATIALLFMAALLPIELLPLTVVAIISAAIGNKLLVGMLPKQ